MKPRITESEWLKAKTVIDLDLYRSAWKQFRKWRLFGAACSRRAMALTPDARLEVLAACAEEFADGLLTWAEMKKRRRTLATVRKELGDTFGPDEAKHDVLDAFDDATGKEAIGALGADQKSRWVFAAVSRPKFDAACAREEREQVRLARDIFGNPFRPVAFDAAWRTSTAVAIAKGMCESREFGAMPILADALQDAGCDNEDVLQHCRDAKQVHVRGCWVVDLVLGKS
jgi:hypothetical protein